MGRYDEVEIYVPFSDRWVDGYELAGDGPSPEGTERFTVRRQSDGAVLPADLPADRIRPAHSAPAAPGQGASTSEPTGGRADQGKSIQRSVSRQA